MDQAWTAINETGVNLNEGGTGSQLFTRMGSAEDAANSDDGDRWMKEAAEGADDLGGALGDGGTAESTCLIGEWMPLNGDAGDGGVGGDDAIDALLIKNAGEGFDLRGLKVGSDLDEDGDFFSVLFLKGGLLLF
jgi:hypothetical protein